MNAYELNKIIGAVLAALVFAMGVGVISDIIFTEEALEEPAYRIAVASATDTGDEAEVAEEPPFAVFLASADAAAGESASRVCSACHSFDEGMENKIGPALYGVVGREIGVVEGFAYSNALAEHEAEVWSYDALDGFLENPQGWAPGTSMGYAGIKDPQERANVVAYLASVTPDAPAFPEPPAEEEVEVAAADAQDTATDAAPEDGGFTQIVASADPADGESAARVCLACHSIEEGAAHMVGPNIHGVFGAEIAAAEGYSYSSAMQSYAEAEGAWSIDTLNTYLEAPMEAVPGTKMSYAGVKDDEQRAAIIAWLHSISPEAGPLAPEPEEAPAEEVAAADPAATEETATDAAPEAQGETADANEADAIDEAEADAAAAEVDEAAGQGDEATSPEEAAELVEDATLEGAAGQEGGLGDEAVANVAEAAADEIAEGGGEAMRAEADDVTVAEDGDDGLATTIDAGDAATEDTAAPVATGAGTEEADDVAAVPAAAASDVPSEAVVPEPMAREGTETGHTDADVEVPTGDGIEEASQPAPAREELFEEQGREDAGEDAAPQTDANAGASETDAEPVQTASVAPKTETADTPAEATAVEEAARETTAGEQAEAEQAEASQEVADAGTATADADAAAAPERTPARIVIEEASSANIEIINPSRAAD